MSRPQPPARTAAALAALALLLGCSEAPSPFASVPGPVVGTGAHTYRWWSGWLDLPEGIELGNTHGAVQVDAAGRVLFNTDSEHAVVVVSPDGEYLDSWGAELAGGVHDMELVVEDDGAGGEREVLYLVHRARREILKTTLDGEVLWRRGWPEELRRYRSREEFVPSAIDVAPDGTIYVADGYGKQWVHAFAPDGALLRSFGGLGRRPGRFRNCHGLTIDADRPEPELWIADRENARIQVFGLDGELVRTVEGHFRRPCCANPGPLPEDGDHGAREWVVADLAGRVTIVNGRGELVAHLGDQPDEELRASNRVPRERWVDGEFLAPHFALWDARGDLLVLEWLAQGRVSKLVRR